MRGYHELGLATPDSPSAYALTIQPAFVHLLLQALTERGELGALPPPAAAFALRRRAQPSASQPSASSPGPPPPPAAAYAATAASGAPLPLSVTVRGRSLVS